MEDRIKQQIKAAKTLSEVFEVIEHEYDTEKNLGVMAKIALNTSLPKLINTLGLKPR